MAGYRPYGDREHLPDITGLRRATGGFRARRAPATSGTAAGGDEPAPDAPWPRRLLFPTTAEISAQIGPVRSTVLRDYQLLLDPNDADGYVRDWHPGGMDPTRHLGYAVQWFGLALTVSGDLLRADIQKPEAVVVTDSHRQRQKSGRTIASSRLLVALVFFGPLAVAITHLLRWAEQWQPSGSVAHGILLTQPRLLPTGVMILNDGVTADFAGKWSLLYVGRGDCDDACKETLRRTRQVRRALGKEMSRVQRLFISTSGAPNQRLSGGRSARACW